MQHIIKILTFTKRLWPYYAIISFLSVLVAAVGLIYPLLTGWAIDELKLGTQADVRHLMVLVLGIFASDLASNLLNNVNGYLGDQMSVRVYRLLGLRYYEHILTLPQSYFDKELSGKIINRLNRSVMQISNFMQMWSNNFLQFVFSTVLALCIVAYFSWGVALLLLSLYPIFILLTIKASGTWQGYQKKINHNTDIAIGRFSEAVSQVKVVKSYGQEKRELNFFKKHLGLAMKDTRPQSKFWHTRDVYRRFALNIIFFGVYALIFKQGADGTLSAGQAVSLLLYAYQIRIPIFTISFLVENTQRAIADSKDYFEVMAHATEKDDNITKKLRVNRGEIVFDGVSFSYDTSPVLTDITLTIAPDTKIALVGESGEGKTTLTNLLLRLYEPNAGTITIDGTDIASVSQHSLRQYIGVVFQEPALFSGTIRENIAYASNSATEAQVIAAAKAANAHEFIAKLEKGYDTEIGERGLKLSGGQKQRIAIARAVLKDAPILILDEATSSLDSRSEQMVQEALERLMKGRTTLIIAHRLSTIANVDQILTLSGGKVDEVGTPDQLAKSGGIYSQLLTLQKGGATASKKLKAYQIESVKGS